MELEKLADDTAVTVDERDTGTGLAATESFAAEEAEVALLEVAIVFARPIGFPLGPEESTFLPTTLESLWGCVAWATFFEEDGSFF